MAQGWVTLGDETGLAIDLRWRRPEPSGTADEATAGWLRLPVAGTTVWGGGLGPEGPGTDWTWIDLFEYLARNWSRLRLEQRDPLGLDGELPSLRARALERWDRDDLVDVDAEERRLWSFMEAHDLAAGLGGIEVEPILLLRSGLRMSIWYREYRVSLPIDRSLDVLEAFGEAVRARLAGLEDGRAKVALEAWTRRSSTAPELTARLSTGLDAAALQRLTQGRPVGNFFEISAATDDNELLAAARMSAGHVDASDMRAIVETVRASPRRESALAKLDALSSVALEALAGMSDARPFAQGYELAGWLRRQLGCPTGPLSPRQILQRWGVEIRDVELEQTKIEAVCAWGSRHGPVILVNVNGKRAQQKRGRRSTLAHEIGHLLVDRTGALPMAEVLGGRAPSSTESRANAFAAELLLPRADAGPALAGAVDAEGVVREIARKYGTSREIVAWQAIRSGEPMKAATRAYLLRLLPAERRPEV